MRIHLLSDVHLESGPYTPPKSVTQSADVVVLAGDIAEGLEGLKWARRNFERAEIVYVSGNHELYGGDWQESLLQLRRTSRALGVNFLEDDVVTLGDARFVGTTLWTDFRYFGREREDMYMSIYAEYLDDCRMIGTSGTLIGNTKRRRRLTPREVQDRHLQSVTWLQSVLQQPSRASTVVVTHHLPHARSVAAKFAQHPLTASFASRLPEDLITRADYWLHGHTHTPVSYLLQGADGRTTRVICNPHGFLTGTRLGHDEPVAFNPNLLLNV